MDLGDLFRQLMFARRGKPPYDKFQGWTDDQLLCKVVTVMAKRNKYLIPPTVDKIIEHVMEMQRHYARDPSLCHTEDDSLRTLMCSVFGEELSDTNGCLTFNDLESMKRKCSTAVVPVVGPREPQRYNAYADAECSEDSGEVYEVVHANSDNERLKALGKKVLVHRMQQRILPSSSNVQEWQMFERELGKMGSLAARYKEDLKRLQIDEEDKMKLLLDYGPTCPEYIAISDDSPLKRRQFLIECLDRIKQGSNQSISSVCSHKRRRF